MAGCKGKTQIGHACRMKPLKGTAYCFTHSPEAAPARKAARQLGGFNRGTPHAGNPEQVHKTPRTIPEIFTILDYALIETLAGDNGIPRNRLLVSISAAYVDAVKVGELEKQLQELLRVLQSREAK
jgi:hypothetical protein